MLVLTRKVNQSIIIGDDIKIVVVDVRGDQVKLGIQAPKDISVHREEIYADIQQENKRAVLSKHIRLEQLEKLLHKGPRNSVSGSVENSD